MYGREISPKKTQMCVRSQRGKEGLRRAGMGSDGCRGVLAPNKRKTRQTETQIGPQGIILARVWGGKLFDKDDT